MGVNINREIQRQIALMERQRNARRVISSALHEHRDSLREGRSMMTANSRFISRFSRERMTLNEESVGIFDKAVDALGDVALRRLFRPTLDRMLRSMGLSDHPRLRRIIEEIIVTALSRVIKGMREGKVSFEQAQDCEYISKTLALSVAESLPKEIFDELFGGDEKETEGIALVIRESIANFFANQRNVDRIAAEFQDIICKMDFGSLFMNGADEIERVVQANMGPGERS